MSAADVLLVVVAVVLVGWTAWAVRDDDRRRRRPTRPQPSHVRLVSRERAS